jgi:hypothetical protein
LNPWLVGSSFWHPSYGSFDSYMDVASNTYLQRDYQYYIGCGGCLVSCTDVQWLMSLCPLLSTSFSPPWKHLGGLSIWNHFILISYFLYSSGIVLAHNPHNFS